MVINTIINYEYDNLKNDINRLTHLYQFYDHKNISFHTITLDNHDFYSNFDENGLIVNDNFCFNLNNKNKIKITLCLTRINQWGDGDIKCKMFDDNPISIVYTKKIDISKKFDENDKKIDTNKSNISNNHNISQINKKKIDDKSTIIDSNLNRLNANLLTFINIDLDFSNLRGRINTHQNDIQKINEKIYYLNNHYHLAKIYIYYIKQTYQDVDNDNDFNIFSQEIVFDFNKDSYLEVIFELLTQFNNY